MNLATYLAAGEFPEGVDEMPQTWNPAWAASLADALAADSDERVAKTGEDAKMSEVGIAACIGPGATETFINAMLAADAGTYGAENAATFNWIGRKLREGKGDIEFSDSQTPTLLAGLVTASLLTPAQAASITAFWTDPVPVWKHEGLDKAPTKRDICWALRDAGTWTAPPQPWQQGGGE